MKKIVLIMIFVVVLFAFNITNIKADTGNGNNNCLEWIIAEWDAAWYLLCLGGSGTNCTISIKICWPFDRAAAESLLGRSLLPNETPVLLSDINGEFSSVQESNRVDISQHIYQPNSPKIIEGSLNNIIIIPAQTVIYSQQFNGFVGYCIFE